MRLDVLLFRLRLAKSRSIAQGLIAGAHMRVNGVRVSANDRRMAVGDVLTMPRGKGVQVLQILALPDRRGPPQEATTCYRVLDAGRSIAIASEEQSPPPGLEEEGAAE